MAEGRRDTTLDDISCELEERANTGSLDLPEAIVEKIVSAIPFPHVFKARALSRAWRSKFQSVVTSASHNWRRYCPAFQSEGQFFGFDEVSKSWHTLNFVLEEKIVYDRLPEINYTGNDAALEGVLLCSLTTSQWPAKKYFWEPLALMVNLLTKQQRVILCPIHQEPEIPPLLVSTGPESYELLLMEIEYDDEVSMLDLHLYDSRSDFWSHFPLAVGSYPNPCDVVIDRVYIDGSLYWYYQNVEDERQLYLTRVTLEDGIDSRTPVIEFQCGVDDVCWTSHLLRVGSRIFLMVTMHSTTRNHVRTTSRSSSAVSGRPFGEARIYELDRERFELVEHARSPSPTSVLLGEHGITFTSDSRSIYMMGSCVTSYHVKSGTWMQHGSLPDAAYSVPKSFCSPMKHCVSFEPGLNPFVQP